MREGIEYLKDGIRWVPTGHMLVDCLTKAMHPALLNRYMQDYIYSLKYDDHLHATKRAAAKERKQQKEERLKQGGRKQQPQTTQFAQAANTSPFSGSDLRLRVCVCYSG